LSGSNNLIPAPNDTLPTIAAKFHNQGLDIVDLVALSGMHVNCYRCLIAIPNGHEQLESIK
jgi:hypothetical protein